MNVHTKGGTNAGWRNPFQGNAMPWQCACVVTRDPQPDVVRVDDPPVVSIRKTNPGYLNRCSDCGERRPTPQAHSVK